MDPLNTVENQKSISEELQKIDQEDIKHPALKRAVEKENSSPENLARQAYDRMHHRHNRS